MKDWRTMDIVEKLRERSWYGDGLEDDAADEIERLRELLRECCEFLEIGDDDCETAREMTILLKRVREAIGE